VGKETEGRSPGSGNEKGVKKKGQVPWMGPRRGRWEGGNGEDLSQTGGVKKKELAIKQQQRCGLSKHWYDGSYSRPLWAGGGKEKRRWRKTQARNGYLGNLAIDQPAVSDRKPARKWAVGRLGLQGWVK